MPDTQQKAPIQKGRVLRDATFTSSFAHAKDLTNYLTIVYFSNESNPDAN
jgi:hypothetical protein